MGAALAYIAAGLIAVWGVAHAVPTGQVLAGFGPITTDNRRVVLQEWLAEAFTMWGIAALVIAVTAVASTSSVTAWASSRLSRAPPGAGRPHKRDGRRGPWWPGSRKGYPPALLTLAAVLLLVASAV